MAQGKKPRRTNMEADRQQLLGAMATGVSLTRACRALRLSINTMKREMAKDAEFKAAVLGAKNNLEVEMVNIIKRAAAKNWQAAAWMLERTQPHRYGRDRHLKGDKGGEAREVQITVVGSKHQAEFGTPATPEAPEPQVENPDG